jgi:hypothetical protein
MEDTAEIKYFSANYRESALHFIAHLKTVIYQFLSFETQAEQMAQLSSDVYYVSHHL